MEMYIYANMMVLKHLVRDETSSTHEEDYVELIRMNTDMLVLKHHVETRCTHEEDYAELNTWLRMKHLQLHSHTCH